MVDALSRVAGLHRSMWNRTARERFEAAVRDTKKLRHGSFRRFISGELTGGSMPLALSGISMTMIAPLMDAMDLIQHLAEKADDDQSIADR